MYAFQVQFRNVMGNDMCMYTNQSTLLDSIQVCWHFRRYNREMLDEYYKKMDYFDRPYVRDATEIDS